MKLKVFGGNVFIGSKQARCVVATTSQAKAAEAAGVNLGYVREYWAITGNEAEVAAAMANPGIALLREERFSGKFYPLSERQCPAK